MEISQNFVAFSEYINFNFANNNGVNVILKSVLDLCLLPILHTYFQCNFKKFLDPLFMCRRAYYGVHYDLRPPSKSSQFPLRNMKT